MSTWTDERPEKARAVLARLRDLQYGGSTHRPFYIFRGVPNSGFNLVPSLGRIARSANLDEAAAIHLEKELFEEFVRSSLLLPFDVPATARRYEWLAVMQHYRAPTRVLDWSASAAVAAYFACVDMPDEDGAVWFMNPPRCCTAELTRDPTADAGYGGFSLQQLGESVPDGGEPTLTVFRPRFLTDRQSAQAAQFTYSDSILADHGAIIQARAEDGDPYVDDDGKPFIDEDIAGIIRIPADRKPIVLRRLHQWMNISAATLFPGIDGIGLALRELAIIEASRAFKEKPRTIRRRDQS